MSFANAHLPQTEIHSNKITVEHDLKNRFRSDQYRIEQPFIQLTVEGYTISAADSSETFTAARPRQLFKNFLARLLGIAAFFAVCGFAFYQILTYGKGLEKESSEMTFGILSWMAIGFGGGIFMAFVISNFCAPIRRATVKDQSGQLMMLIEPTSRFHLFHSEFAIRDAEGRVLATFSKNFLASIFQKRWHARDFQGRYLFSAIEDNIILSVMRRYLNLARLIPMHFMFSKGGGKAFGEFRRGCSLRDKYKLRYNPAAADGWLMVAASLMLDTGENR